MHERKQIPDPVRNLAHLQCGVLSTAQLQGYGVPRRHLNRLLDEGHWQRLDQGLIYTGAGEFPWHALLWAAFIAGGDGAVVAGRSAARLHGLIDNEDRPIEILVPNKRSPKKRWFVSYQRGVPGIRSSQTRRSLPCTSVADTVIDLCAAGTRHEVVPLITAAIQRRLTSARQLDLAMSRRSRLAHRDVIAAVVTDAHDGAHSALEMDYLRNVERAHGLPAAERQVHASGTDEWVDVLYRKYRLVIELDGRDIHAEAGFRDRGRDNRNAAAGWTTLRYGWSEIVANPCGIAAEIAAHLVARGWNGDIKECAACLAIR